MSLSLLGIGHALPPDTVASEALEPRHGFPAGYSRKHLGIHQRHVAAPEQRSWHLGAEAAQRALNDAGCSADQVDLLLCHASCPELHYPDPAWFIAAELGLSSSARVLGIRAQCAGFISGLDSAASWLLSGRASRVLVVCAERMFLPAQSYSKAALLFGDGAAAALLGPGEALRYIEQRQQPQWADRCLLATGQLEREGWAAVCADLPAHQAQLNTPEGGGVGFWDGAHIFQHAVEGMGEATERALSALNLQRQDIDHYLYHQANGKILRSLVRNFELPADRVRSNVHRVANISSATVPLLLSEGLQSGEVQPGQRVLLGAFGAGYVTSTAVLEL